MKSYLSLIPISAKVHRRQNRMTLLCIVFAVFMVTAVFSMAEMGFRMEQARLVGKHGNFSIGDLLGSSMGQTLLSVARPSSLIIRCIKPPVFWSAPVCLLKRLLIM